MPNITLEITHSCNLSCSFCYIPENKSLTANLEILEKLPKKIKNVLITGGEPTLHKNFEQFWKKAYTSAKFTHISTNGILLEKYINLFKDFSPKSIQISSHLYNLSTIIKKVKLLQDSLPNTKILLNYVFIPGTDKKLIELLSSKELENTTIKILFPISLHKEKWWTLDKFIMTVFNIINNTNLKAQIGFSNMLTAMILKEMSGNFYGGCEALTEESYMINPEGDVFLCFFLRSETYLGNLYKNSWKEIKIKRDKKIKEVWEPKQDCIACKFVEQCRGGCAAIKKYYDEELCKTIKNIMDFMR